MNFALIKSMVSDCICRTAVLLEKNIPEKALNLLANEYADKILKSLKDEKEPIV